MNLEKNSTSKSYALSMRVLLCALFFNMYNIHAEIFKRKETGLKIKDSTYNHEPRTDSTASIYISKGAKVYNLENLSNVKVITSADKVSEVPSKNHLAKSVVKIRNERIRTPISKKDVKLVTLSPKDENHFTISNSNIIRIATTITNTYKFKDGVLWKKHDILTVISKNVFVEYDPKNKQIERIILSEKQTRPPPSFNY